MTYQFVSPVKILLLNRQTDEPEPAPNTQELRDILPYLKKALRNDDVDLADHMNERSALYDIVQSIKLDGTLISVHSRKYLALKTTCTTNSELSKDDIDDLIEYMTGQLSDGYGEGFDQNILDTWEVDSEEDPDGEEEDVQQIDVYVRLWYKGRERGLPWSMKLLRASE